MKDFGIEIQAFHTYIMAKNDSVNTAIAYSGAVKVFLNHFKIRPTDITATMIIDYLNTIPNLHTRRNSHNAVNYPPTP